VHGPFIALVERLVAISEGLFVTSERPVYFGLHEAHIIGPRRIYLLALAVGCRRGAATAGETARQPTTPPNGRRLSFVGGGGVEGRAFTAYENGVEHLGLPTRRFGVYADGGAIFHASGQTRPAVGLAAIRQVVRPDLRGPSSYA